MLKIYRVRCKLLEAVKSSYRDSRVIARIIGGESECFEIGVEVT